MSTRVLICDDDEGIIEMLDLLLSSKGYDTFSEPNSMKVIEEIRRFRPDIILLDLWMPIISGDLILKTLRADPETHTIPVIVISASQDGAQIARQAGANDFIAKPFDLTSLETAIGKLTA